MSAPSKARRWWIAVGVVGVIALAAAWFYLGMLSDREIAVRSIPARPAVSRMSDGFQRRIAEAEDRARNGTRPTEALVQLARLYHANGFYSEASLCYDGLQRIDPRNPQWPHLGASILASLGMLEAAEPPFRRAADLDPGYLPARIRLGDVLIKSNQIEKAFVVYSETLERFPGEPYALLGLARCDLARDDWEAAREKLREAVAAFPEFIGTLSLLVTVSEHFGEETVAEELRERIGKREFLDIADPWLESLMEDCYDPYRLSVAAAVAGHANKLEDARRWLERAVALAPASSSYLRQLALLNLRTNDYKSAFKNLNRAIELKPDDAEAWILLVNAVKKTADERTWENTLIRALSACPESATLRHIRGRGLADAGRLEEAVVEFSESKRIRPSEANSYLGLSTVYFRMGRVDDAIAELEAVLAVEPNQPVALGLLARHAIVQGDSETARGFIEQLNQSSTKWREDARALSREYEARFGSPP